MCDARADLLRGAELRAITDGRPQLWPELMPAKMAARYVGEIVTSSLPPTLRNGIP